MSERFDNTLTLAVGTSTVFAWIITLLHVGAMMLVCLVPLGIMIRVSLLALLTASVVHILQLHALRRSPRAVCKAIFEADGDWILDMKNQESLGPCRLRSHFAHPWLTILQLQCQQRRLPVSLVLAADAVGADSFRRLRARLSSLGSTE